MKNNLSYYEHDVNSHNHWKFKTLRKKYEWSGEGKFWALNNLIAQSPGCVLDITSTNKKKAVAAELEFTLPQFEGFLAFLSADCELIHVDDGSVITNRTQGVLKRVFKKRELNRDQKSLQEIFTAQSLPNTEFSDTENHVSHSENKLSHSESEQIRLDKIKEEKNTIEKVTVSKENLVTGEVSGATAPAIAKPEKSKEEKEVAEKKKRHECHTRRVMFREEMRRMQEEFPPDMCKSFYDYWGELNKSKTKMKWEMQQTWELRLRLQTWKRKSEQYKTGNSGTKQSATASQQDELNNIYRSAKSDFADCQ